MALVSLMGLNLYAATTQNISVKSKNNQNNSIKTIIAVGTGATMGVVGINKIINNNKEEITEKLKPLKDFFTAVSPTTTQNIKIYYDDQDGTKLFDTTMYTFLQEKSNNDEAIYHSVMKKQENNKKFLKIQKELENHTKKINDINTLLKNLLDGVDINIIMGTVTHSLEKQSEYLNKLFNSSEDNAIIKSLLAQEKASLDVINKQQDPESIKKIRLLIVKTIIDKIVDTSNKNLFIKNTFDGVIEKNTTHENPLMRDGNELTIKFNYEFFKNTYCNLSSKSISGTNILEKFIKSGKDTNILDKFTKFNRLYDTIIKFLKTMKDNHPNEKIFLKEIFPPISDKK
jgi:hypothetical protein